MASQRRSREGAWIEIALGILGFFDVGVAPARERGLKYSELQQQEQELNRRSREGAWIEIASVRAL